MEFRGDISGFLEIKCDPWGHFSHFNITGCNTVERALTLQEVIPQEVCFKFSPFPRKSIPAKAHWVVSPTTIMYQQRRMRQAVLFLGKGMYKIKCKYKRVFICIKEVESKDFIFLDFCLILQNIELATLIRRSNS